MRELRRTSNPKCKIDATGFDVPHELRAAMLTSRMPARRLSLDLTAQHACGEAYANLCCASRLGKR